MMASFFRRGVIALSFVAMIAFIVLSIGCSKIGEMDEGAPMATLDSGVDKKVSRSSYDMAEGGSSQHRAPVMVGNESGDLDDFKLEEPSDTAWTQPQAAPGMTTATSAGSDPQPVPEASGNDVISRALASAGIDEEKINNWVFPKAYAADHGSDDQYLVRTGDVHLDVASYENAQQDVGAIANKFGGYISNSNSQRYSDDRIEGWVMVRVPADKFFEAWEEIRALGDITQEQISTEDVSRQFLANHSQIKNLLAQQATLQEMLSEAVEIQRKHGLGEGRSLLLDVQERLFNVTSQLQSVEDRQNALSEQISKSTITAHLSEVIKAQEVVEQVKEDWNWGTGKTFDEAIRSCLNSVRRIWHGFIWFVFTGWTWILPWAFWIAVGIFCYRKWVRPHLINSAREAEERFKKAPRTRDRDADAKQPTDKDKPE